MINLRNLLSDAIQQGGESQNSYAKSMGISSGHISKYLKGQEIGFHMVLSMVQKFYPEREVEFMGSYCEEISKPKNIRVALEYAHIKRIATTSKDLIHRALSDTNEETKAWAEIYQLQLQQNSVHEIEYLKAIKDLKVTTPEMEILISILTMYAFYNNQKFEIAYDYIERIRPKIEGITDPFLKKSFTIRIDEVQAHISLKQFKNITVARETAKRILNANLGPTYNSTGNFILALSYLTESYDTSLSYYQKCLETNKKLNRVSVAKDLKDQIAFLQLLWDKSVDRSLSPFINALADGKDYLYSGPIQRAMAFYYQGRKENNTEKLFLSMHHFGKLKDFFRAELPKMELVKRNIPAEAF